MVDQLFEEQIILKQYSGLCEPCGIDLNIHTHLIKYGIFVGDDVIKNAKQESSPPLNGMMVLRIVQPMKGIFISFGYEDMFLIEKECWITPIKIEFARDVYAAIVDYLDPHHEPELTIRPQWMIFDLKNTECKILRAPSATEVAEVNAIPIVKKRKRRANGSTDVSKQCRQQRMLAKQIKDNGGVLQSKSINRAFSRARKNKTQEVVGDDDAAETVEVSGKSALAKESMKQPDESVFPSLGIAGTLLGPPSKPTMPAPPSLFDQAPSSDEEDEEFPMNEDLFGDMSE